MYNIACVVSRLEYVNEEKDAIEAEFIFPMDDDSAVYHFQVEIDGRVIIGECQEKKQAEETYNDARSSGYGAFMLNEDEHTGDIFQMKVGNLPSMKTAMVSFSYAITLKVEETGTASFKLPTVLNPRYNPSVEDGGVSNPASPHHAESGSIPYSLTFTAVITGSKQVSNVKAACVPITWQKHEQGPVEISLKEKFNFEHDLEILIEYDNPHQSTALLSKGDTQQVGLLQQDVVMLNIYPECDKLQSSSHMEFIFIIDRSGSMAGTNMQQAKDTLLLFLKSLPVGCYFNIISFGSSYSVLFPDGSEEYNEKTLTQATKLQAKIEADMRGTAILQPLKHMYENMKRKQGYPRQVFVLTDGGVSNTAQVINQVKDNANTTRVFTFGIGSGASTALVKGMARAGKGKAEFVSGDDRLQAKVVSCLKLAMQPSTSDMTITWKAPDNVNIVNIPTTSPVIFNGEHFVSYGIIQGQDNDVIQATVSANVGDTAISECVEVTQKSHSKEFLVNRLAAKQQIKQLEADDGEHKNKMIILSLASNIVCKHTAFVGVDRETREVTYTKQYIPVARRPHMGPPPMQAQQNRYRCIQSSKQDQVADIISYMQVNVDTVLERDQKLSELENRAGDLQADSSQFYASSRLQSASWIPSLGIAEKVSSLFSAMGRMFSSSQDTPEKKTMAIQNSWDQAGVSYEAAEVSSKETGSAVSWLIRLQSFDGSWKFSEEFTRVVGRQAKEFQTKFNFQDASVAATLLAITWLEVKHGDTRDEWSIIADKAAAWLNTSMSLQLQGRGVDQWKQEAKYFI